MFHTNEDVNSWGNSVLEREERGYIGTLIIFCLLFLALKMSLLILFRKDAAFLSLQLINIYIYKFMDMKVIKPFNRITFIFLTSQNSYIYAREIQTCFTTSWPEQFSRFLLVDGWVIC